MKIWKNWKQQSWFPYTVAICVGILFYMLLSNISIFGGFIEGMWGIVKPLFYGLILAYLIDPVARFYEKKLFGKMKKAKVKRSLAVVLATVSVVVIVGLLAAAIIPSLVKSITNIFSTFATFIQELDDNAGHLSAVLPFGLESALADFSISGTVLESLSEFVTGSLSNMADTSVTIGGGFVNFVIAFVLAIYYMMDKTRLQIMGKKLLVLVVREKRYTYIMDFLKRADFILLRYIKGNLIEAFIVGLVNAIFMLIAGMPYVLLISIVVGITNIAPTFGPVIGAIIGSIMLVLINPWYALAFIIFTVVLQTVDGYILKPKLFGESFGVSPLLILICIILGGRLCGVVGILLAIPFAAIAQFVADDLWKKWHSRREAARKKRGETSEDDIIDSFYIEAKSDDNIKK